MEKNNEIINESKYVNKLFSLVQSVEEAKKQLKEKFNIDAEIKDCNTIVIESMGQLSEALQADVARTIYGICPNDMVEIEYK